MVKKAARRRAVRSDGNGESPLKTMSVQVEDLKTILGHDRTMLDLLKMGIDVNLRKGRGEFLKLYGAIVDAEIQNGQEDTELGRSFAAVQNNAREHVNKFREELRAEEEQRRLEEEKAAVLENKKKAVRAKTEMAEEIIKDLEGSISVVSKAKLEHYAEAEFGDVKAEREDKDREENKGAEKEYDALIATLQRGRSLRNFVRWQRTISKHAEAADQIDERLQESARKLEEVILSGVLETKLHEIENERNRNRPEGERLDEEGLNRKVSEGMEKAHGILEKLKGYVTRPETILLTDIENGKRLVSNDGFKVTVPNETVGSLVELVGFVEAQVKEKIEFLNRERQAFEELNQVQKILDTLQELGGMTIIELQNALISLNRGREELTVAAKTVDFEMSDNVRRAHQELLERIGSEEDKAYLALIGARVPEFSTLDLIKIISWNRPQILKVPASERHVEALKTAASDQLAKRTDVQEVAAQLFMENEAGKKAASELEGAKARIVKLEEKLESQAADSKADDLERARKEVAEKTREVDTLKAEHKKEKEGLQRNVSALESENLELKGLADKISIIADASVEDQATWERTTVLAGSALAYKGLELSNNTYQLILDTVILADWLSEGLEIANIDLSGKRSSYDIASGIDNIFRNNSQVTKPFSNLEMLETVAAIASLIASGKDISDENIRDVKQSATS